MTAATMQGASLPIGSNQESSAKEILPNDDDDWEWWVKRKTSTAGISLFSHGFLSS